MKHTRSIRKNERRTGNLDGDWISLKVQRKLHSAILLLCLLLCSSFLGYQVGLASFQCSQTDLPYYASAPLPHSYVVDTNGVIFYMYNGTTGKAEYSGMNSTLALQCAVDNCASGGGSVFVRQGVYSAAVVLKNYTRLILEKGATGLIVTADSGATCMFEDHNSGVTEYYVSGSLVATVDHAAGLVDTSYVNAAEYWGGSCSGADAKANPEQTASYIIYTDGTTTYAVNGATGRIDYSGADASRVIMNVAWENETVLVKEGVYSITSCIDLTEHGDDITIMGVGENTVLQLCNGVNEPVIYAQEQSGIQIRNLKIDGNKAEQTEGTGISGIRFAGVSDFILDTLWIENTFHQGIDIIDYSSSSTKSHDGIIRNIYTYRTGAAGIYVGFESYNLVIDSAFLREAGYGNGGCGVDQDGLILAGETEKTGNITLSNVQAIHNWRFGISLWDVENCTGTNIYACENGQQGIYFKGRNEHIDIRGIQANRNGYSGIFFDNPTEEGEETNCHVSLQGYAVSNGLDGVRIVGSTSTSEEQHARCIVLSINAMGNNWTGIALTGYNVNHLVRYVVIHDCIIWDNGKAASNEYNGILLWMAQHCQINNVLIDGNNRQAWGIREGTDCGYNIISNCNMWNCLTGGIYRNAASTYVTNCYNGTN